MYQAHPTWHSKSLDQIRKENPGAFFVAFAEARSELIKKRLGEPYIRREEAHLLDEWREYRAATGLSMTFDEYRFQVVDADKNRPKPPPVAAGVRSEADAIKLMEKTDYADLLTGSHSTATTRISRPPMDLDGGLEMLRPYDRLPGRQLQLYWKDGAAFILERVYSYLASGAWSEYWYQVKDETMKQYLGPQTPKPDTTVNWR